MSEMTTITVADETWSKLNRMRDERGKSFDDAINELLTLKQRVEKAEELGEVTREALEE